MRMNEMEGLGAVRENERSLRGEMRGQEREELEVGTER